MLRGRTAGSPKKNWAAGLRRGGVGGYNLHSVPPDSPPDGGTVAHQPRAGCIRFVRLNLVIIIIVSLDRCLPSFSTQDFAVSVNFERSSRCRSCKEGVLQHVCGIFRRETASTCCVSISSAAHCCMCNLYAV